MTREGPLWAPSAAHVAAANVTAFRLGAEKRWGIALPDWEALYAWSVARPEEFWVSVWEGDGSGRGVTGVRGERVLVEGLSMREARWFPEGRLNFAQNLLRSRGASDAVVFWGESRIKRRMSHEELWRAVARLAAAMRAEGVVEGDRVAAYMPNVPETVVAMLAAASIGAVFTSASPDFGVNGVVDRFGQTEPKLLVACDGYYYGGKTVPVLDRLGEIAGRLPSVKRVVVTRYVGRRDELAGVRDAVIYDDFVKPFGDREEIQFAQLPFGHPLYIMYSSGTTGVPKCMVHSAGGTLLQHLKEHCLHGDVKPGDRAFYYTTCGWMMWNWLVSTLAAGATLLLYDGSPFAAGNRILFDYADAEGMTHFGTSAKFLASAAKLGLKPRKTHALKSLRVMLSTGSPLAPEGFEYVYRDVKGDLQLSSISGGTDIISCFVLGSPVLPVWRGEIQCRGLGLAVEVWDDDGNPVRGRKGELVCTRPFPAMPIAFWNDPDGTKYRAAYFDRFPDVWCHGDLCEITEHGGMIIYGRSDAALNPGGVRIGTAEIYRQVEKLPEVLESLAIGQDWPPQDPSDVRVVLFVKLREGLELDDELTKRIKQVIRDNTTRRHVPAKVLQVADVPRTKNGKVAELAARQVVHGRPVKNQDALANPEALEYFRNRPELNA